MDADLNIRSLLEKIKKEGIEEARGAAEQTLNEARLKAESIVKEAEKQAGDMIADAEAEVRKRQEVFETAMSQAGRNLMLSLKSEIIRLCEQILERQLAAALTPDVMKQMILKMIDRWQMEKNAPGLEILLSEKDRREVEELLFGALQERLKEGVTLRPVKHLMAGFRIGEKEGSMYYDVTPRSMAEILSAYLNPRIAGFLEDSPGKKRDPE